MNIFKFEQGAKLTCPGSLRVPKWHDISQNGNLSIFLILFSIPCLMVGLQCHDSFPISLSHLPSINTRCQTQIKRRRGRRFTRRETFCTRRDYTHHVAQKSQKPPSRNTFAGPLSRSPHQLPNKHFHAQSHLRLVRVCRTKTAFSYHLDIHCNICVACKIKCRDEIVPSLGHDLSFFLRITLGKFQAKQTQIRVGERFELGRDSN